MKDLDFKAISAAPRSPVAAVDVPEWGGRVYVKPLTALEYTAYLSASYPDGELDRGAFQNGLVAAACCTAAGAAIFPNALAVAGLDSVPVRRVFDAAQKLNKLRPDDLADEKKDSPATPPAASPSA